MGEDYESKLEILENFPFLGGETVALQRLEQYINDKVNQMFVENKNFEANSFVAFKNEAGSTYFNYHLGSSLNNVPRSFNILFASFLQCLFFCTCYIFVCRFTL